jgi:hypothetical protein
MTPISGKPIPNIFILLSCIQKNRHNYLIALGSRLILSLFLGIFLHNKKTRTSRVDANCQLDDWIAISRLNCANQQARPELTETCYKLGG